MKILIVSNLCPPYAIGGYEIACANVAAGLRELGHEICLATTRSYIPGTSDPPYVERCLNLHWFRPIAVQSDAVRSYPLFQASVSDFDNTAALLRLCRTFDPDIVYVWNLFGIGGIALLDLLNIVRVPWVIHFMDDMAHHLQAGAPSHVRSVFGGSMSDLMARGRAIAMSNRLVQEIVTESRLAFERVNIVPGWVDLAMLPLPSVAPTDGLTRFVTAGQVVEHKGIPLIIEAASQLRSGGLRDFSIDVFGQGDIPFYIDMAQQFGVADMVRFLGPRTQRELLSLYPTYSAFLFPTWEREPFGFAPIEAAACGCIPILTRQCGAAERLVNGAHCLKIDRTAESLANAMETILTGSVDLAALSRRAAAAVRRDLSFERALQRIAAILGDTAAGGRRARCDDARLELLLHTKHHIASGMMFG